MLLFPSASLTALRPLVPFPFLIFSIYLAILYSDGFWTTMIGWTEFGVACALLTGSALCCVAAIAAFEMSPGEGRDLGYAVFTGLMWLIFSLSVTLIYLTRDVKKFQSVAWVSASLVSNRETFFVAAFHRTYPASSDQLSFVDRRTSGVHDSCVCVLVVSAAIYAFLVLYVKDAGEVGAEQRNTEDRRMPDAGNVIPVPEGGNFIDNRTHLMIAARSDAAASSVSEVPSEF
jgi:hypothetical protein